MLTIPLELAAQQFVSAARGLADADLRGPSRLPAWTRGHVVAHVVLNAEGFVSAARGLVADGLGLMYPSGVEAREAAIDELSRASVCQLVSRLEAAHASFRDLWDPLPAPGPCATATDTPRFHSSTVPGRRLRELQVHLVDLDIDGVDHDCWLDDFVDGDLPLQWATVPLRTSVPVAVVDEHGGRWSANATGSSGEPVLVSRRALLAWTLDRTYVTALPVLGTWGNRSRWENESAT